MYVFRRSALATLVSLLTACADSGGGGNSTPVANAGVDQLAWKGAVVTLDGRASRDPEGRALTFAWLQTEGTTVALSDDRAVTPTFVAPRTSGALRFALEVRNGGGGSAPDEVIVVVQNRAPYAAAGPDQVSPTGNVLTLDPGRCSDPDGDPITVTWFQVSGPPVALASHPDGSASFIAPATPAVLEFGLVASDGEASSQADGLRVQVVDESANWPPLADAGPDLEVARRSVVSLLGAALDREYDPLTWSWEQIGGPAVTLVDADGPSPSFVAPETEADLEFRLVVADELSTGADRVVVRVRNQPPVIAAIGISPEAPVTTDPLVASAVATDADEDPLTLTWEWSRNGTLLEGEHGATLDASLTTRGDVIVARLTAGDGLLEATREASVVIQDAPPVLTVSAPATAEWGATVAFGVTAADPDGDAVMDVVLLHGPAGMTLSTAGAGTWTPTLPMFDTVLDVAFGVGVAGYPDLRVTGSIRVEDPSRAYPLRRTGIEIPVQQSGLVAADLDGNGTSELLVAGRTGLYELARAGTGYAQRWVYPFAPGAAALKAVEARDLDADGKAEIFFAAAPSYYYYGAATKPALVRLDGATRREAARVELDCGALEGADLDADGAAELVCLREPSGYASTQALLVLDASTLAVEWQSAELLLGGSLAVGNVDLDAALEVVTGNGYVFDGVSGANEWAYDAGFGGAVDTGDLDGDGVEEVVGMSGWDWVRGFSAVVKSPLWELSTFDNDALLVADVDGDGTTEVVVGDGQWGAVTAYRYQPATNDLAIAHAIDSQDHGVTSIAAADLDGDGALEVAWGSGASSSGPDVFVVAGPNPGWTVEWKTQDPTQLSGAFLGAKAARTAAGASPALLFEVPETDSGYAGSRIVRLDPATGDVGVSAEIGTNWSGLGALDAVDYDGDGVDEAFVGTAAYYDGFLVAWDVAADAAEWTSPSDVGSARAITHADLNGDGAADLVAMTANGFIEVYDVKHGALLWKSTSLGVGKDVEVLDVDGDGALEIVALSNSRLYLFRKASGGTVPWLESASVAVTASDLAVGDCDGDGAPEFYALGDASVARFDAALTPLGSFGTGADVQGIYVEDLGYPRKNLLLGRGDDVWYFGSAAHLEAVDPVNGAVVWRSPPLWGTLPANSLGYVDLDGDGFREIAFGTSLGMYLTR